MTTARSRRFRWLAVALVLAAATAYAMFGDGLLFTGDAGGLEYIFPRSDELMPKKGRWFPYETYVSSAGVEFYRKAGQYPNGLNPWWLYIPPAVIVAVPSLIVVTILGAIWIRRAVRNAVKR